MGGHQQPDNQPRGYSTWLTGDSTTGYHTDGFNVLITPKELKDSVDRFAKQLEGKGPSDLIQTLTRTVVDVSAFGQIPNADNAFTQMQRFVNDHAEAMGRMGVSLADFIARVQAAAEIGFNADPATRAAAARAGGVRAE